jgi:low affinity Fe/Cu permease
MSRKQDQDIFTRFTSSASVILGHAWIFVTALIILILWGFSGPLLGFSDTWQLIINTSTTIITFLMVFIIQNTQNRDNMAINIKLDALMKKSNISSEKLLEAEDQSDKKLEKEKKKITSKSSTRKRNTSR